MDDTDKKIAALLQDDCFLPQAEIARAVGRVTSSVNERNLQQVMENPRRDILAFCSAPTAR